MIEEIVAALGVVATPFGFVIKQFMAHGQRLTAIEQSAEDRKELQSTKDELVITKLDAIGEKIDLRCDTLEKRIDRIERKVLNGEYRNGDH